MSVARLSRLSRHPVPHRLHIMICQRLRGWSERNRSALPQRIAIRRPLPDILVRYVDELALSQVRKKPFRIAPASGHGTASLRQHVDVVGLGKFHDRSTVVRQIARKANKIAMPVVNGIAASIAIRISSLARRQPAM